MRVVEAPKCIEVSEDDVCVFLAGGITDCRDWQREVIFELLKYPDTEKLYIFNPRRENFDIKKDDPQEQIEWEFFWLNNCDIFSMFFANSSKSVQPICMYELGRHLYRMQNTYSLNDEYLDRVVIGVEDNYLRKEDVYIQSELALGKDIVEKGISAKDYAKAIYLKYKKLVKK